MRRHIKILLTASLVGLLSCSNVMAMDRNRLGQEFDDSRSVGTPTQISQARPPRGPQPAPRNRANVPISPVRTFNVYSAFDDDNMSTLGHDGSLNEGTSNSSFLENPAISPYVIERHLMVSPDNYTMLNHLASNNKYKDMIASYGEGIGLSWPGSKPFKDNSDGKIFSIFKALKSATKFKLLIPEGLYVYILKDYNNFRVWGIGGRVVVVDLRRFNVHYVFPYTFLT